MATPHPVLDLIERSIIVQCVVTISLVGAVIFLACTKQPIPDLLAHLTEITLGFYFGSKVGNSLARANLIRKSKLS
uniref:Uncharacterized protein n=1 Tax=viral metagenome TaxID=1070528 RepID=A0A6H1ZYA4_9ZZZZ